MLSEIDNILLFDSLSKESHHVMIKRNK